MPDMMSTRQVARYLNVNEKVVYSLISDKELPATKITGKWLFPHRLVDQWLENETVNVPKSPRPLPPYHGLLVVGGSNDILLDRSLALFNDLYPEHVAVFGNLGSLGGIRTLGRERCHMATSHLLQGEGEEYNFDFAEKELGQLPAVVNFCRREQGILLAKGNPEKITTVADLAKPGMRIVNRPVGTGTRLLLDGELTKAGMDGADIEGYANEVQRHMDVGLEVLSGRAHAGPGIRAVAGLLGLDFLPLRWERYDLLVLRGRFFEEGVQLFMGLLHEPAFRKLADSLEGYDLSICGKMVFPKEQIEPGKG
ncbi:MAG: helix-turn-helix transcriptional regulator [Deltaproteobacteria bacterium]|nr:helix-turn-helix transcriptional regulator [Deltaproteobacteria bacterium]